MGVERRFGQNADGTLSLCRAKPENVGKGRCRHGKHIDSDADDATIQAYNASVLEKTHGLLSSSTSGSKANESVSPKRTPTPGTVFSVSGGHMSRSEFHESVESVAEQFDHGDYTFIREFYKKFEERLDDPQIAGRFSRTSDNIFSFLTSSDPVAVRTRRFLGSDVELRVFSRIIATNVHAMTASEEWSNNGRKQSTRRIALTSIANDMNRKRYVASVMFFGGRCCYCQKPFKNGIGNERAASGEHLTPITPENPPPGTTRYGNMALACIGCNKERASKDLTEWVMSTKRIPKENKHDVLERISNFRRFALYEEMDPKQNKMVDKSVKHIDKFISKFETDSRGRYDKRTERRITGLFNSEIRKLQESMR